MFSLFFSGGLKAWVVLCKMVRFLVACIIHPTLCVTSLILLIAEVLYYLMRFEIFCIVLLFKCFLDIAQLLQDFVHQLWYIEPSAKELVMPQQCTGFGSLQDLDEIQKKTSPNCASCSFPLQREMQEVRLKSFETRFWILRFLRFLIDLWCVLFFSIKFATHVVCNMSSRTIHL